MANIAVIPGDGIGPEVTAEAEKILRAIHPDVNVTHYDLGARLYLATGETLPASGLDELRNHDAILLGAVGDPAVPPGVLERDLLLKLRFELDHGINLRPSFLWSGVASPIVGVKPGDIDIVVVREGTEGLYCGAGGVVRRGTTSEIALEESVNTRFGVERVVRDAFARAETRERKKLTLVHKNNVLAHAGGLWTRVFTEVSEEYPDVRTDYMHVDAAAMFLVTEPRRFDVIVTDNLFGDILTDIAAAVSGGIGLAASGNINPTGEFPSMFEPVHGSAPDIAGQALADPVAAILSVAMLLRHLKDEQGAERVEKAVGIELESRVSSDSLKTSEVGERVLSFL